jgi:hypothetical protein
MRPKNLVLPAALEGKRAIILSRRSDQLLTEDEAAAAMTLVMRNRS